MHSLHLIPYTDVLWSRHCEMNVCGFCGPSLLPSLYPQEISIWIDINCLINITDNKKKLFPRNRETLVNYNVWPARIRLESFLWRSMLLDYKILSFQGWVFLVENKCWRVINWAILLQYFLTKSYNKKLKILTTLFEACGSTVSLNW